MQRESPVSWGSRDLSFSPWVSVARLAAYRNANPSVTDDEIAELEKSRALETAINDALGHGTDYLYRSTLEERDGVRMIAVGYEVLAERVVSIRSRPLWSISPTSPRVMSRSTSKQAAVTPRRHQWCSRPTTPERGVDPVRPGSRLGRRLSSNRFERRCGRWRPARPAGCSWRLGPRRTQGRRRSGRRRPGAG